MNKCIFIGNLGRDAELKFTQSGSAFANFSVAVTERWKDKNGDKQEHTEWVRCQMWGKRAESLARYLTKGSRVAVEGKMRTREYEKDGVKRYATEIRVDAVHLLGESKGGGQHRGAGGQARHEPEPHGQPDTGGDGYGGGDFGDDDVPFMQVDERLL